MISLSFINNEPETLIASDPYIAFNCFIENTKKELEDSVNNFFTLCNNLMVESQIDNDTSVYDLYIEKEGTNILTKIGTSIANLFKKVIDLFAKLAAKIKNTGFKNKSDMEKVAAACKKNPNLANQLSEAYNDGVLTVQELKSVSEVEKAYEELIRLNNQADPDTIEAKYEAFKETVKKSDQSATASAARTTTVIAGSITGVLTVTKLAREASKRNEEKGKNATKFANYFHNLSDVVDTGKRDANGKPISKSTGVKGASELSKKVMNPLIGNGDPASISGQLTRKEAIRNASYILCGKYNHAISSSDKFFTRLGKIIGVAKNNFSDDEIKLMTRAANEYNAK